MDTSKIKQIEYKDGVWKAWKGVGDDDFAHRASIKTKSYRAFRKFCADHGLVLPNRKDVLYMHCRCHMYEYHGWRKFFE